jgi:hypothetical protein
MARNFVFRLKSVMAEKHITEYPWNECQYGQSSLSNQSTQSIYIMVLSYLSEAAMIYIQAPQTHHSDPSLRVVAIKTWQ